MRKLALLFVDEGHGVFDTDQVTPCICEQMPTLETRGIHLSGLIQPAASQHRVHGMHKIEVFYRVSLPLRFEAPEIRRAICPGMLRRRSKTSQMPPAGCNLPSPLWESCEPSKVRRRRRLKRELTSIRVV